MPGRLHYILFVNVNLYRYRECVAYEPIAVSSSSTLEVSYSYFEVSVLC